MVSPSPGLDHGGETQLDFASIMLGRKRQMTLPGTSRYHGNNNDSTAPWASLWIRFPAAAGKFQNCTFGDFAPLRSLAIALVVLSA
jgi:hypothetical protein